MDFMKDVGMSTYSCQPCSITLFVYFLALPFLCTCSCYLLNQGGRSCIPWGCLWKSPASKPEQSQLVRSAKTLRAALCVHGHPPVQYCNIIVQVTVWNTMCNKNTWHYSAPFYSYTTGYEQHNVLHEFSLPCACTCTNTTSCKITWRPVALGSLVLAHTKVYVQRTSPRDMT